MPEHAHAEIERFLNALPVPGFVFDLKTRRLLAANPEFQQLMCYEPHELLAMRLDDLRPPEDVPLMLQTLETRPPAAVIRRRYVAKDGRLLWVTVKYRNMRYITSNGKVLDVRFTVVIDVQPVTEDCDLDFLG